MAIDEIRDDTKETKWHVVVEVTEKGEYSFTFDGGKTWEEGGYPVCPRAEVEDWCRQTWGSRFVKVTYLEYK